jgi:hypothetical protein
MNITQGFAASNSPDFGNKITTKLPSQPSFEEIYSEVISLLIRAHEVMEKVIPKAKEFFSEQSKEGKPIDAYLFNDLVRYYAKEMLDSSGFAVENDIDTVNKYEFKPLSNNGLSGIFNGRRFHILKADHSNIPMPASEERKKVYNQQLVMQLDSPNNEISGKILYNILILWEVNGEYDFLRLRLACPKAVGKTRESLEVYFNQALPHAAEMIKAKATVVSVSEYSEEIEVTKKEPESIPKQTS